MLQSATDRRLALIMFRYKNNRSQFTRLGGYYFFDRIKHNKLGVAFMRNGREIWKGVKNELDKRNSSRMSEMCQQRGI